MKRTFTVALLALALVQNTSSPQTASTPIACGPPWFIVSPPNPKISGSTIAVAPTQSSLNVDRANSMAKFVHLQYNYKDRWKELHIYVFKDKKTAQIFAAYQARHQHRLLKTQDYKNLVKLWPHVWVRYRRANGREFFKYPRQNPKNWWAKQ